MKRWGGGASSNQPEAPCCPGANRMQRKNPEITRKRWEKEQVKWAGALSTAGGIYINTKQMQDTEGVCANMKQACVFTAGGADRSEDGGGRAGAHVTFHLSEGQPSLPGCQDVRFGGSEAAGWLEGDPKLPWC